jgi:hypothetical protein
MLMACAMKLSLTTRDAAEAPRREWSDEEWAGVRGQDTQRDT